MDFLLDCQQVHQGLVDDRMGPVAPFVEEAAESVFHGPGRGGKHVGLDGGRWTMFLADQAPRNVKAVGIDLVQTQETVGEIAHRIADVDPFLAFVEVDIPQAVGIDNVDLLVLSLAQPGVDDDRSVVAGRMRSLRYPSFAMARITPFELPGGRGTAGVEEMPGNIHFQGGVELPVQHVLYPAGSSACDSL